MEPSLVFTILTIITVCASHPLETLATTATPEEQNKIITVPLSSGVNGSSGNTSQAPIKSSSDESRLEITLKIDESDKEIIDNDMGKYTIRGIYSANKIRLHLSTALSRLWWEGKKNCKQNNEKSYLLT